MPVLDIDKTVALDRESTFGAGISDWDSLSANGGELYLTEIDVTGIEQAIVENENIRQRPFATWGPILGLKNIEFSGAFYLHASTTHAAAGAQAAASVFDEIWLGSCSGLSRTYAAGVDGGGTATAFDVDEGDLDSSDLHSFIFYYDASASTGQFVRYASITDGGGGSPDTVNLTTGFTLDDTPADADTVYGCAHGWIYDQAVQDHANAAHYSHTMFFKGRHSEWNYEARGVRFGIGQITIEAGSPIKIPFSAKGATFNNTEGITQPDLDGTVAGRPGYVVGRGTATEIRIEDVGEDLDTGSVTQVVGTITITVGVEPEASNGPGGTEGVHGYTVTRESLDAQMIEFTVYYDDQWYTDFRAETRKHMLIQVGDQPDDAMGFYAQNLAIEKVTPGETNGLSTMTITCRCLEGTGTLTGTAATDARLRSKLDIMVVR